MRKVPLEILVPIYNDVPLVINVDINRNDIVINMNIKCYPQMIGRSLVISKIQ